jgi:hypothetical protein
MHPEVVAEIVFRGRKENEYQGKQQKQNRGGTGVPARGGRARHYFRLAHALGNIQCAVSWFGLLQLSTEGWLKPTYS